MSKKDRIISAGLIAALGVYIAVSLETSYGPFSGIPGWHTILFTLPVIFLLRQWARLNS